MMASKNIIKSNCAIIILAAGASARLGRPKQLLPYQGKSLLEHAVDIANDSDASPVIVVLGAGAAELEKMIDEKKLHIVENEEWQEGIASSIRCGMNTLKRVALLSDAVILMVCDQPHIETSVINELIATQKKTGKPIVASRYGDTMGTPVLFFKSMFAELLELEGDKGAKKIIDKYPTELAAIAFPLGELDIDTEEDYKTLK